MSQKYDTAKLTHNLNFFVSTLLSINPLMGPIGGGHRFQRDEEARRRGRGTPRTSLTQSPPSAHQTDRVTDAERRAPHPERWQTTTFLVQLYHFKFPCQP